MKFMTRSDKTSLIAVNTHIYFMVHNTCSEGAIQILQVVLNSLGFSASMINFVLKFYF